MAFIAQENNIWKILEHLGLWASKSRPTDEAAFLRKKYSLKDLEDQEKSIIL